MSTHVEWSEVEGVHVAYTWERNLPAGWTGLDKPRVDRKVLVLEDGVNCLAYVFPGTPEQLLELADRIKAAVTGDD